MRHPQVLFTAATAVLLFSVPALADVSSLWIYGSPTPGTGNVEPRIAPLGSAYLGNPQFGVRLVDALPNSSAFLLIGSQAVDVPSSFHINVLPFFISPPLPTGAAGELLLPLAIPAQPVLVGFSAYFQWAVSDPATSFGIAASKGMEAVLVDPPLVVTAGSQTATIHPLNTVEPLTGVTATLPQGWTHPADIEFTRDGTRVVLASTTGNSFLVVDVATGAVLKTIPVSTGPNAVAIAPDGARAYGATFAGGTSPGELIEIDIDPASPTYGTAIGAVTLGFGTSQIEGMSISADGRTLVASSLGFSQTAWIIVVDIDPASPSHNQVTQSIAGTGFWADVVASPDGSLAYVTQAGLGSATSNVLVYDVKTGLPIGAATGLGAFATDVDITQDGKTLFVATPNSDAISRVDVDPTSPNYLSVTNSLAPLPKAFSLGLSPDESEVWVACSHGPVIRLDAGTLTVLQSYPVTANAGSGISVR